MSAVAIDEPADVLRVAVHDDNPAEAFLYAQLLSRYSDDIIAVACSSRAEQVAAMAVGAHDVHLMDYNLNGGETAPQLVDSVHPVPGVIMSGAPVGTTRWPVFDKNAILQDTASLVAALRLAARANRDARRRNDEVTLQGVYMQLVESVEIQKRFANTLDRLADLEATREQADAQTRAEFVRLADRFADVEERRQAGALGKVQDLWHRSRGLVVMAAVLLAAIVVAIVLGLVTIFVAGNPEVTTPALGG